MDGWSGREKMDKDESDDIVRADAGKMKKGTSCINVFIEEVEYLWNRRTSSDVNLYNCLFDTYFCEILAIRDCFSIIRSFEIFLFDMASVRCFASLDFAFRHLLFAILLFLVFAFRNSLFEIIPFGILHFEVRTAIPSRSSTRILFYFVLDEEKNTAEVTTVISY